MGGSWARLSFDIVGGLCNIVGDALERRVFGLLYVLFEIAEIVVEIGFGPSRFLASAIGRFGEESRQ